MSARTTSATSNFLNSTGNLPGYTGAYTMMGWFYISVDTNTDTTMMSVNDNSLSDFDIVGHSSDGTTLRLGTRVANTAPTITTGSNLTAGEWNHIAMVRTSSTAIALFLNGVSDISNTVNVGARPAVANKHIGIQVGGFAPFNGRSNYVREWGGTALSASQIVTEMNSQTVVLTTGLTNDCDLESDAVALTGTNYTENGTITYEDNRPFGGTVTSSGAFTAQSATTSGTAEITKTSSGAFTAQSATTSGTAEIEKTSSGSVQAVSATTAGTANTFTGFTSSGAFTAQSATTSGTAEIEKTSSGSVQAVSATTSGTAEIVKTSSGSVQAVSATTVGSAAVEGVVTSSGSFTAQSATTSGTAEVVKTSSGSFTAQSATIVGNAEVAKTSSGAFTAQSATTVGTATITTPGIITSSGAFTAQNATTTGTAEVTRLPVDGGIDAIAIDVVAIDSVAIDSESY